MIFFSTVEITHGIPGPNSAAGVRRTLLESQRAKLMALSHPKPKETPARECKPTDFEVPDTFLNRLQDLSSCFLKDIAVFITDKISSFCLQVALQVLYINCPSFVSISAML
ncbi:Nucleolar protein 9 [Manis javanica]|nr:Nucleolar protein 9 [Manis javanica]